VDGRLYLDIADLWPMILIVHVSVCMCKVTYMNVNEILDNFNFLNGFLHSLFFNMKLQMVPNL
jgi:hypothetical protein